ncbi:hypothetical protein ACFVTC_08425 [Streptomyces sp. NPDC057950]|uniref:hypothetical protein n=1 Tax=Streptomyces sp. NPDC057950 TaxID=3346288 RepID=UPI0036E63369
MPLSAREQSPTPSGDLEARTVSVHRSYAETRTQCLTVKAPKSAASVRAAPIYQHLVNRRDHEIADYVDGQIRKVKRPPRGPSGT